MPATCDGRGDSQALAWDVGSGAALDVAGQEPLPPESPLWSVKNLANTPHVAGLGECYIDRCIEALVANVTALETGRPRTGLVDRNVGY